MSLHLLSNVKRILNYQLSRIFFTQQSIKNTFS